MFNPAITTDATDTADLPAKSATPPICFAALLRANLGEAAWSRLTPAMRSRFVAPADRHRPLVYRGQMQWVYCSPAGAFIGRLLRQFAILPDRCARDAAFEFIITGQNGQLAKQRRYALGQAEPFEFNSRFHGDPELHEEFSGGIGMKLGLQVIDGALLFHDRDYTLRIGTRLLSLPRWLSVGRFELLHRSIDQWRFQIIIRVAHPLLGTLFYQRGEFRQDALPDD